MLRARSPDPTPCRAAPHFPGTAALVAGLLALAGCAPSPLGPPPAAGMAPAPRLVPLEPALASVPAPSPAADEAALAARAAALRTRGAALRARDG